MAQLSVHPTSSAPAPSPGLADTRAPTAPSAAVSAQRGLHVSRYDDWSALPAPVVALLKHAEADHVQFGLDWLRAMQSHVFGHRERCVLHVLWRHDQAIAALPVLARKQALGHSLRNVGNYYTCVFSPALADTTSADDLAPLLMDLRQAYQPLGSLQLAPLADELRSVRVFNAGLQLAGWKLYPYFCHGNWYLRDARSYADYLRTLTSKMRSNIKRMTQKLLGDGGQIVIYTEAADADAAVEAYQQVYAASWKQPEPYPDFIPNLIRLCAQRGWMRLGVVTLNGSPIAAQLWMVAHGRADIYKVAYDERYKPYTPGTVLTAALMQHVLDIDRVREVDYLMGDDEYKRYWMPSRRERHGLIAFNPRTLHGLLGHWQELARRRVKQWLRRPAPSTQTQTPLPKSAELSGS